MRSTNSGKSAFISIETVDGIVKEFDGNTYGREDGSIWQGLFGPIRLNPIGRKIMDVLNECDQAGYDLIVTEQIGKKTVYRMKLKPELK